MDEPQNLGTVAGGPDPFGRHAPIDISIASWNVDGWHTIRQKQLELSDQTGAEIALLHGHR